MDRIRFVIGSRESAADIEPEINGSPLLTEVAVSESTMTWLRFAQPHRPKRDYSDLGPSRFDRSQYENAFTAPAEFS